MAISKGWFFVKRLTCLLYICVCAKYICVLHISRLYSIRLHLAANIRHVLDNLKKQEVFAGINYESLVTIIANFCC